MSEEDIINIVSKYVKEVCKNDSAGHDWWHIKRVYNNAILINEEENANSFVVKMIAILHDLYDYKYYEGNSYEKLSQTLKELGVYNYILDNDIENIIYSCTNLGFSNNMVEKKQLSKEGKIVQDADRLDGLGAIGIARTFAYGGKHGKLMYDPDNTSLVDYEEYKTNGSNTSISHFYDKILKLKELLNTNTAKKIADGRHKFVEEYLKEFYDEWSGIK